MTSKYKYRVTILRHISHESLKDCLESLKENQILSFPIEFVYTPLANIRVEMYGCGYADNNFKYIKLTNIQRRKFIQYANEVPLSENMGYSIYITLDDNEYIKSLPLLNC